MEINSTGPIGKISGPMMQDFRSLDVLPVAQQHQVQKGIQK